MASFFRILSITTIGCSVIAAAAAVACGDSGGDNEVGPDGGGGNVTNPDARGGDPDAGNPMSTMRIAHLAPELGPIDFCYQGARSGTFVGPVLSGPPPTDPKDDAATDAAAADAADAGDAANVSADAAPTTTGEYRSVSKYFNLEAAGPITIAIVAAGSASCGNALVTGTVTLDPGKLQTVVVTGAGRGAIKAPDNDAGDDAGDAGSADDDAAAADTGAPAYAPLEIAAFTDDRTTSPDKMRVRVIHAALGTTTIPSTGALGVRVATMGSTATVLTDRVEPRKASTPSQGIPVDGLGYATAGPMPPPTRIAVGPAITDGGADAGFDPWQSEKAQDLELRGDSLHTAFILTGANASEFEVVWCADTTTTADQTTCIIVR